MRNAVEGEEGVIGIVGGVGPVAGIDLQNKILSQTRTERDQDHVDVVTLSFPQRIPDRTAFIVGKSDQNPAVPIAEQLLMLEKMGCKVGAVPCNTAHSPVIFDQIHKVLRDADSRMTLLNMIEEVPRFLLNRFDTGLPVGLLCTLGTYETRVYDDILQHNGLQCIRPDEQGKHDIQDAIYSAQHGIKSIGVNGVARRAVMRVIEGLEAKGARAVILGCTELPPLITDKTVLNVPAVDPTLLLARAAVKAAAPQKLVPEDRRDS